MNLVICVCVRACMHLGGCVHARILRVGERSCARGYAHQYMRVYKTDKAITFIKMLIQFQ